MKTFARIVDGHVVEIIPAIATIDGVDFPIEERYHPDFIAQLVPYDTANPPAPPRAPVRLLADLIVDLQAAATAKRWEIETAGIALPGGVMVKTGVDDQLRINSVIEGMDAEGFPDVPFKAASGWITLTLDEMKGIRGAISKHVRACFLAERRHHETIASLSTVAAAESYDLSIGWPQQSNTAGLEA